MTKNTHLILASALVSTCAFAAQAQDNSVTVVLSEELEIVEPCSATKSNVGRVLFQNISETVTEMDPKTGLQPRLAESWEDIGDGTWRFNLRQGVTFSDGSVMDAEDVAHSLVRMKSPDIACEIGAKFFGGIDITSNIVDAHTIDVTANPAQSFMLSVPEAQGVIALDDLKTIENAATHIAGALERIGTVGEDQ